MLLIVNACLQCVPFLSGCKNINKCSFYKKILQKEAFFCLHRPACTAPLAPPRGLRPSVIFSQAWSLAAVSRSCLSVWRKRLWPDVAEPGCSCRCLPQGSSDEAAVRQPNRHRR